MRNDIADRPPPPHDAGALPAQLRGRPARVRAGRRPTPSPGGRPATSPRPPPRHRGQRRCWRPPPTWAWPCCRAAAAPGWTGAPAAARCDLVVDTGRLDAVLEHAAGDQVVRVQAGVRARPPWPQALAPRPASGWPLDPPGPGGDGRRPARHRRGRAAAAALRHAARPADRDHDDPRRRRDRPGRRQGGQERGRVRHRQAAGRLVRHARPDHRGHLPGAPGAGRGQLRVGWTTPARRPPPRPCSAVGALHAGARRRPSWTGPAAARRSASRSCSRATRGRGAARRAAA